jgi:hypothetical protein
MTKMRVLLYTHLLIVAASLAAAQVPNVPATELDAPQVRYIHCLARYINISNNS